MQQQLDELNRRSRGEGRSDGSRNRPGGSRDLSEGSVFSDSGVTTRDRDGASSQGRSRYYSRPTDASDWNQYRDWNRGEAASLAASRGGSSGRYIAGYRPSPPPPPRPAVRPQVVVNIQTGFGGYGTYWTNDWYGRYGRYNYWRPPVVIAPTIWWRTPGWGVTWGWFHGYAPYYYRPAYYTQYVYSPIPPSPVYYNYGDNIVYRGDMVYINGVPYVSADKYYEQGLELAKRGENTTVIHIHQTQTNDTADTLEIPTPALPRTLSVGEEIYTPEKQSSDPSEQWMPLGTFALLNDEEKGESDRIFQLAMNRGGILRGNLYDQKADKLLPIQGAVDQETQRAAFQIVGEDEKVYESGLWNLTQESLPILVQEGPGKSETIKAVRLQENESGEENTLTPETFSGPFFD